MASKKMPLHLDVLTASRYRIRYVFDHFEKVYISFSGGKDSSVMMHLVMDEAIKRNRKVLGECKIKPDLYRYEHYCLLEN